MSQTKDFNEAKQLFFAQFGNALVTNTYLKIALAVVSLIALGLLVLNFRDPSDRAQLQAAGHPD